MPAQHYSLSVPQTDDADEYDGSVESSVCDASTSVSVSTVSESAPALGNKKTASLKSAVKAVRRSTADEGGVSGRPRNCRVEVSFFLFGISAAIMLLGIVMVVGSTAIQVRSPRTQQQCHCVCR